MYIKYNFLENTAPRPPVMMFEAVHDLTPFYLHELFDFRSTNKLW